MQPTGRRRWWAIVAAASLVTSGLAMAPATASPEPEGEGPSGSIDADVSAELEAEGRADVWVRFADRPDMSQFAQISDWNERGQAVVDALKASAEASQGTLRDSLDDQGMDYEAFWATNSLRVSGADPELVTSMSHAAGVEGIYPTMQIEVPEPEPATPQMAPNAVEWGVNDINAPEVWDEGIDGQDIVVASIDTGAQWDHPALINQYRGYNGPGDVDHNYSWFDAAGTSPSFPADTNGHGTHVTGTMVGDDGGDNQIGVAPGARWIAANGCCPNDAALINSGQWMLEPTDLDGENPDVSMRPHVINNSWGTTVPSNDPFMSDIIEAWAASGQFGVFANGNNGPGCATSGAPGSLIVSYSVGNYNSSHNISATSSRGPGQDGEIKPDIAAPGSAIRSAWPGSGYNTISGTSMASPHVAGAVALAWSASPTLSGDIEETRDLLDGTAIDTEDLQCGGTAENNNVFGEGRLDAHALVDEAPRGDAGTLTGVVIDAEDDTPIAGAQVHVVGPLERTLVTNSEGAYTALLSAGTYEMTVTAFGYQTHTDTVTVEVDETTTVNVALEAAPSATVSGVVTDGSGYGFPLYARIAAEGTPEATFTDPETGEYSFDIPAGATYTLTVQVQYDGYTTPSREVTVDDDTAEDFAVPVNAETCTAPGYHIVTDGLWETFDEQELPEGWEIVDHQGNGQVWRFDDPGNRGNMTGGEGGFAVVNSDFYGSGNTQNTTLVTPSIDMSGDETPAVGFNTDYYRFTNDVATVRVSLDGGDTWEDVEQWTASRRGPREELIPLPMAAGESDVRIGFNYQGTWGWWWQLDNVFVGERSCVPAGEGGYVVGNVYDNYDEGIVGATVTNLDAPEESAVTTATPADENLDDGFYWIFSANPGENLFEASARNYESQTQDVTVVHADAVRADFTLGSGLLVVEPTEIESTQVQDEVEEHTLSVTNTGTGAAEVELLEGGGDFTPQAGHGVDSEPVTLDVPTSFAAFADDEAAVGTFDEGFAPNDTWEPMPNYPRVVMDNRVVNVDGNYYSLGGTTGTAAFADVNRFNSATETWEAVAPMPQAASAVNAAAVGDQIVVSGGWVASATSTNTYVYDVAGDSWTQVASAPTGVSASGTAVIDGTMYVVGGCSTADCTPMSNVAMAYDVANDSWEQLANYPTPAAFNVCGAVDGELVCSGGNPGSGGIASTYAYDPGADTWQELESAPTPHWAAGGATANGMLVVQGGVQGPGAGAVSSATYAFDGGEWTTLDAASTPVYRGDIACGIAKVGGSTGGFSPTAAAERLPGWDDCETFTDVEWLDLEPDTFTVGAGETVEVTVTTDSTGLELGTYTASIHVRSNTPQSIDPIPVTMNVVELPIEVERWAGEDRYETAVLVSQGYEPGVDTVIVATGRNYPDALTGSALAGSVDAPVLLTRPDTLNMVTAEELERLQPGRVLVVGGVNAVQDRVVDMIRNVVDAPVERVSGTDRYGTAVAVSGEFDSAEYVYVATGRDYPDALAAAPRAGAEDSPVLLVPHDRIPAAVKAELDRLAPSQIRVLGGDGAVDDAVVLELRREHGPTVRLAGEDRYETNVRVTATYEDVDRVYVASGQNWPDALTGGARAASDEAPLLLTRAHALPGVIATEVERLHPDDAVVLGGPRVVSENVITQLRELR